MVQRYPSIHLERLPGFPSGLARVLKHTEDPDISADKLLGLLAADRDLGAQLLDAANHPFFGPRSPIRSLAQTIACMGRAAFHDLLFTAAVCSIYRKGATAFDPSVLLAHSLACGALCRELARRLGVGDTGLAYRAGLVHDLGLLVLAAGPREASAMAVEKAERESLPLWVVEESILGTNHARLGYAYGERLNLPRPLLEAIRFHHQPELASPPRTLPAMVGLADLLSRAAGLGYGESASPSLTADLQQHSAWRILCDERPALLLLDLSGISREVLDRVSPLSEAAGELFVSKNPITAVNT